MEHVENLEQRVNALEQELGSLRVLVSCLSPNGIPVAAAAHIPCKTKANQPPVDGAEAHPETDFAKEAPGIDKLRALLAAHGIHPGNEIVRQEIAGMREQEEDP